MKSLVVNDLHLGVQRTGGTTLASASALRGYAHTRHRALLQLAVDKRVERVIVNGDLADAYDIPLLEALEIYGATDEFLTENPQIDVVWALGNHDLSKSSDKLGTVAFVGALLAMKHPSTFKLVDKPATLDQHLHIIPHVPNQDLFELELQRIPESTKYLLLHCNLDNKFAAEAEHSLDLSREQAKELKKRGITVILGHEHQGREILAGAVIVVGNQFPTSVSDCLAHGDAQKDGTKRALIIDHTAETTEFVETWNPDGDDGWFARINWRELADVVEEGSGFVRVEGTADASEAADVIKSISTFRQRSKSYVVTNAVKIDQIADVDDIASSVEEIRSLSVMDLLFAELTEPQRAAIKKLQELKK